MTRLPARLLAVLGVVCCLFVISPIAAVTVGPTVTDNGTASSSGADAAGTIGSHGATIEADIRTASLETRLADAANPAAKAQVIATELDRIETTVTILESQRQTLTAVSQNGSLDQEIYASRLSRLSSNAEIQTEVLDHIRRELTEIEAAQLQQVNVTAERVETLDTRLEELVTAGGETPSDGIEPAFYRQVHTVAMTYNEDVASHDLGVLGTYLDDERVNLHIVREDGETEIISFRTTANSRVRELRAGPHPDASLRVTVDESTARSIVQTDAPGKTANEAFLDGEIAVDGLGKYNAVRWLAVNVVLAVVRFIVGLIEFLVVMLP